LPTRGRTRQTKADRRYHTAGCTRND
jgi:hypothetical protein